MATESAFPLFFQLTPQQYDALCKELAAWRSDPRLAQRLRWRAEQERWGTTSARFKAAVRQAYQRGIDWHLSPHDYELLVAQPCAVCGDPTGNACGLDRLDHSKPYQADNVRPCCGACNWRRGRGAIPLSA